MPRKKKLVEASGPRCFWVHQGPALKNLKELKETFEIMSDEQFVHHVNSERNDFARWVLEILKDRNCALALRQAKTRKGALSAVAAALKGYK